MSHAHPTAPSRLSEGLDVLKVIGGSAPTPLEAVSDIAPDLARYAVEFAYGDLYTRPGLTLPQRQLATVAALAALGNAEPQLRFHIAGALNVGCTRREVVEVLMHTLVYAGFPAALNGITAARAVFAEHPAAPGPPEASDAPAASGPATAGASERFARGLRALSEVDGHSGQQVVDSLNDIAPELGRYLIEFVFGDVYQSTGIDLKTREMASVAMCTALGTAGPQLRVHIHGFLNTGGTREEAVEVITHLAAYAGFPAALNGSTAAREVFAARDAA
ncbi:4-carboxymuconolactone decarboxylase [Streptomyces sp. 840.1]|uniref:carboxymuconolactone decarboxylase family protein n=1 Tax=Streptomyces sp. 840.1 TaxID=2485152 RepID=UPI000F48453D|nr:carboxymuconolactone decarboxylase family protein [Streptomyces sp. 840.1]ROQ67176.1 4-carboxymuconolactone decarboxylase [Streptomyces sp. 840.1]